MFTYNYILNLQVVKTFHPPRADVRLRIVMAV